MIHFAPRGHLGFPHLLLASAIIAGSVIDKKPNKTYQSEKPIVKATFNTTNILNAPFNIKK